MHRAHLQADVSVDGPQDAPWDRFATLDDPDDSGIVLAGPPAGGRVTHGHGGRGAERMPLGLDIGDRAPYGTG
ncbi:hypothetical protein [Streptomyces sp. NPDC003717]|uniref:hypothetical protein n=1 Tax=Streptomyces sp. NPDC003717 TaxID=3154276 RepID=UPI0033BBAFA8